MSAHAADLDETRRLLYMALAASRTDKYNLVGTLTNSLAHHGHGIDPEVAMDNLIRAVDSDEVDSEAVRWVGSLIERITGDL